MIDEFEDEKKVEYYVKRVKVMKQRKDESGKEVRVDS